MVLIVFIPIMGSNLVFSVNSGHSTDRESVLFRTFHFPIPLRCLIARFKYGPMRYILICFLCIWRRVVCIQINRNVHIERQYFEQIPPIEKFKQSEPSYPQNIGIPGKILGRTICKCNHAYICFLLLSRFEYF